MEKNKKVEKTKTIFDPVLAPLKLRGAAYFVDIILFIILFTGVVLLASFLVGFQDNYELLQEMYIKYGVYVGSSSGGYNLCNTSEEVCQNAWKEFFKDDLAFSYYSNSIQLILHMFAITAVISSFIYEFLIPTILGNGQTIGMKIMKVCLVNEENYRISNIQLFTRFLFGKLLINLLIPIFATIYFVFYGGNLIALLVIIAIPLINIIMTVYTKTKSGIANTIGKVIAVSMEETYIFESKEAYIAAKCEQDRLDAQSKKTW